MFTFFTVIGAIASIVLFFLMMGSGFEDASFTTAFFSMLFSTIISFKLALMHKTLKETESEVSKLKMHFGIKDGDRVNNSDIMKEYPTDDITH